MQVESLSCNKCGAPLSVISSTNYVTCAHCGSQLVVRRTENSAYTEVLAGIKQDTGQILSHTTQIVEQNKRLENQITRMRIEQELRSLDEAWEKAMVIYRKSYGGRIPRKETLYPPIVGWSITITFLLIVMLYGLIAIRTNINNLALALIALFIAGIAASRLHEVWQKVKFIQGVDEAYADYWRARSSLLSELDRLTMQ